MGGEARERESGGGAAFRVARCARHPTHLQRHADLRRGEPDAAGEHDVRHLLDELLCLSFVQCLE